MKRAEVLTSEEECVIEDDGELETRGQRETLAVLAVRELNKRQADSPW